MDRRVHVTQFRSVDPHFALETVHLFFAYCVKLRFI